MAILAGGLALRMRPLTDEQPKALIEVAGRPFVEHQLALLRRHGVRRVVLPLAVGFAAFLAVGLIVSNWTAFS